jgi:hypothetical protein
MENSSVSGAKNDINIESKVAKMEIDRQTFGLETKTPVVGRPDVPALYAPRDFSHPEISNHF